MINLVFNNILRFIVLVIIQVFILNNIHLFDWVNPYLYVLFIILMPLHTPKWILLVCSFLLGMTIDAFMNTLGMHIAACVFIAYIRPFIIDFISPGGGYEAEDKPNLQSLGLQWFLTYAVSMVLLHHFVLYFLEVFRLSEFFDTMMRISINSIFTILLIILSQFLFFKKKSSFE